MLPFNGRPLTYCIHNHLKQLIRYFANHLEVKECLSPRPVKSRKPRASLDSVTTFIDFKKVHVIGGKGGNGCLSFLQLFLKEWAGPDGGNGGNGGHVIFKASTNLKDFGRLKPQIRGEPGENGRNKHCHGKNAQHTEILVPFGTVIRNVAGQEIANLKKSSDFFIAARGGCGGKGNHFFLTNEERAPAYAEDGAMGDNRHLLLELQTMADVGLIGFPNAGKSTLLRALSRARPKVAAYPFTTLNPHVGIVHYDDYVQVAVADIPGLICEAHKNRGLGISFLRHIERCVCLLYVIDLSSHMPWTQLVNLKFELDQYQKGLSKRPHAIVANKIDLPHTQKNLEQLEACVNLPVFAISAKKRMNIESLLFHIRALYDKHTEKTQEV